MKKLSKIFIVFISVFLLTIMTSHAMIIQYDNKKEEYTGSLYTLVIDGKEIETPMPPIIFNDRALVPLREVFEAVGATVNYDSAKKEISVVYGNVNLKLTIGSGKAILNNHEITIPDGVTPKLIAKGDDSAKTMVPVRFISETIGMSVEFDGENGIISIKSPEKSASETPVPEETKTISALGSAEAYMDGEDTVLDITASDGFSGYTTELLTEPTRVVIHADYVAARSAMVSSEINKGVIKFLRIAYKDKGSTIVLDTDENIGDYEVSVNGNVMSIRIHPYVPPVSTPTPAPVIEAPVVSSGKIIVLDAGHGGSDPGTSGNFAGVTYLEKDINLSVTLKVADILRSNGYNVQLTREGDTYPTLEERSAFANSIGASLFVSIHSNSYESSSANGTEVYYSEKNNGDAYGITSQQVAEYVFSSMMSQMDTKSRGVKSANHVVTRTSNMPAILIELGFMSNPSDMSKLSDPAYQDLMAKGIADGIMQCIGLIN